VKCAIRYSRGKGGKQGMSIEMSGNRRGLVKIKLRGLRLAYKRKKFVKYSFKEGGIVESGPYKN